MKSGVRSGISTASSKVFVPNMSGKQGYHHKRIMTASQASLKIREPSTAFTTDTKSLKKTENQIYDDLL